MTCRVQLATIFRRSHKSSADIMFFLEWECSFSTSLCTSSQFLDLNCHSFCRVFWAGHSWLLNRLVSMISFIVTFPYLVRVLGVKQMLPNKESLSRLETYTCLTIIYNVSYIPWYTMYNVYIHIYNITYHVHIELHHTSDIHMNISKSEMIYL
jgi:hypothetical protein